MATFTAQILIGEGHPNHGGIEPRFVQWLSENSCPAWILEELPTSRARTDAPPRRLLRVTWIPQDSSTILEDGLLLTLAHGFQTEDIRKLLPGPLQKPARRARVELDDGTRQSIRHAVRALPNPGKIVVTVLDGSSLLTQLEMLSSYPFDVEVCKPCFCREFSHWRNETVQRGTLAVKPLVTQA